MSIRKFSLHILVVVFLVVTMFVNVPTKVGAAQACNPYAQAYKPTISGGVVHAKATGSCQTGAAVSARIVIQVKQFVTATGALVADTGGVTYYCTTACTQTLDTNLGAYPGYTYVSYVSVYTWDGNSGNSAQLIKK